MGAKVGVVPSICLCLLIILINVLEFIKQILNPFYRLMTAGRVPTVLRTPDDRFKDLHKVGYAFKSNYIELDGGCGIKLPRVHYLDEGPRDGKVILCLHGEPAWSFLYRKMIPLLASAGYRVVVPDFIGFGKSDKYSSARNYTHELHTLTLRLLIDQLNLKGITLVCQDWGGLTGLSVVKDCPGVFSSLVIMNTGVPSPILDLDGSAGAIETVRSALPFILWRSVVKLLGTWLPLQRVFNSALKPHLFNLPAAVVQGYVAPFPSALYCGGTAAWPLLVPLFKDDPVCMHMWEAKNCLKTWKKPVLVMFSDSDPITRGTEKLFLDLVPQAVNVVIKGAGHFLQETHGEELSTNILKFLKSEM